MLYEPTAEDEHPCRKMEPQQSQKPTYGALVRNKILLFAIAEARIQPLLQTEMLFERAPGMKHEAERGARHLFERPEQLNRLECGYPELYPALAPV